MLLTIVFISFYPAVVLKMIIFISPQSLGVSPTIVFDIP
nr:MAG TPA: hypothetical protein [Caudoviricetes sp.]